MLRKPLLRDGVSFCFSPSPSMMPAGSTVKTSSGRQSLRPCTSSAARPCAKRKDRMSSFRPFGVYIVIRKYCSTSEAARVSSCWCQVPAVPGAENTFCKPGARPQQCLLSKCAPGCNVDKTARASAAAGVKCQQCLRLRAHSAKPAHGHNNVY